MKLTLSELKSKNAVNNKYFIAYKDKIYDISDSELFRFGLHFNHEAGNDLTDFLKDAPHGEEVLKKFPVVGRIT